MIVYPNSDGTVRDWHGAVLGRITRRTIVRLRNWSFTHGVRFWAMRVTLADGTEYYGRGSDSIAMKLHALK